MKIVIEINHPKHYYQFKYVAELLRLHHEVYFIARDKEIVFKILEEEKVEYYCFGKHYKNIVGKLLGSIEIFYTYYKLIKKIKPDLLISKASLYSTMLGKLMNIKSVIFPDSEIVVLTNKIVSKFADLIITPKSFAHSFGEKHHRVNGFFEETYLSHDVFTPNPIIKEKLAPEGQLYAILRFVSWNANHDIGKNAVSTEVIKKIISRIDDKMKVYITSEAKLPPELSKYALPIPKNEIHSALYYASLYIGDSQSMATESSLLGTPAIRCNKFVGENDMNAFKVLENDLHLLYNFPDWNLALKKIDEIEDFSELKKEWIIKANDYYSGKKDINSEIVNIIQEFLQKEEA